MLNGWRYGGSAVNRWEVRFMAFLGLSLIFGCRSAEPLSNAYTGWAADIGDRCSQVDGEGQCLLHDVSLVELIAVPEKFHRQQVRLIGYVTLQFEGNSICLSGESRSGRDCVFLDIEGLDDPGFREGWILVQGEFDGEARRHLGCCSG